jgi:hypothetical protein
VFVYVCVCSHVVCGSFVTCIRQSRILFTMSTTLVTRIWVPFRLLLALSACLVGTSSNAQPLVGTGGFAARFRAAPALNIVAMRDTVTFLADPATPGPGLTIEFWAVTLDEHLSSQTIFGYGVEDPGAGYGFVIEAEVCVCVCVGVSTAAAAVCSVYKHRLHRRLDFGPAAAGRITAEYTTTSRRTGEPSRSPPGCGAIGPWCGTIALKQSRSCATACRWL